jgi:hypothetical protein
MRLIEEIERCVPAFDYPDEPLIEAITSPEIRALVRRKNGALALSGALVIVCLWPAEMRRMERRSTARSGGLERL